VLVRTHEHAMNAFRSHDLGDLRGRRRR
jgi:hypothetical protein